MSTKLLEKTILKKVDELIEIIISLSKRDEGFEVLYDKSIEKTKEIIPLILHFIDGKTSLVVPMLYQLIMEKLPDPKILSSFGNLKEEVDMLLNNVKQDYLLADEKLEEIESFLTDENQKSQKFQPGLYSTVTMIYPNYQIISDYRIGGQIVDIFIPELKMLLLTGKVNNRIKLDFYCKKNNFQLIQIPKEIELDYRKLLRFLRQQQIN